MEDPEEFYCELEKLRLHFRGLGYNFLKLIEEYQLAGSPFGETGKRLPHMATPQAVQCTVKVLEKAKKPAAGCRVE